MLLPNGFTAQGLALSGKGRRVEGIDGGAGAFMELPTCSCRRGLLGSDG